ncbi:Beta-1,4-galactosyltransferase 6 [Manis javanica]|nr:Beta-1,4-galactosyltransferase 6 [Manis javanica]
MLQRLAGPPCCAVPPVRLSQVKRILVNVSEVSFDEIHQFSDLDIESRGHWRPKDCKPRRKTGTQPFNRAMLFNVDFKEAMKDSVWDGVIFHHVNHLPGKDRNYYRCGEMPRHFAAKLDKYMYILPQKEFFGGVSGLTVEQFRKISGFPNASWE